MPRSLAVSACPAEECVAAVDRHVLSRFLKRPVQQVRIEFAAEPDRDPADDSDSGY